MAFPSRHNERSFTPDKRLRQAYKDNGANEESLSPNEDIGATTTYLRATLLGVNGLPSIAQESVVGGVERGSEAKSVAWSR